MGELRKKHKKKDSEKFGQKETEAEAEPVRDGGTERQRMAQGSKAGCRGLAGPAEGQAWMGGGDGWRAHQFLKAKARRAAESVKFTLLISCNNL